VGFRAMELELIGLQKFGKIINPATHAKFAQGLLRGMK
jgi:hypothetical protein